MQTVECGRHGQQQETFVCQADWEWTQRAIAHAHIQILCGACYDEARTLNGF